ncbi:MAG: hypothetical protein KBD37_03580 [Burkholderiales bacterium]|nr:hypothetical protein [Burkholderiales bacterium]
MNLITAAAINEVYKSHVLIEEWFKGTYKATPQLLQQLLSVFTPDFSMISPNGNQLNRHDLKHMLSGMRGARPNVRIEVTTPQVILSGDNYCILKYEEFQHMEQEILHRLSTAVFISDGNGSVLWHHLHETWAPKNNF